MPSGAEDALPLAAAQRVAQQRNLADQAVQPIDGHDGAAQVGGVRFDVDFPSQGEAERGA
ncbi:hypothetical protein D3C72_2530010 [compost metagenome]